METEIDLQFKITEKERRIDSVTSARGIYDVMLRDNQQRSSVYAQVRNQMEGGRPHDPKTLEDNGQGYLTNVNFGDARSSRDRTLLPYWKMVHDVPHLISVEIESGSTDTSKWQAAMEEAFDDFRDDWGADYFVNYMRMAANFVDYGPGMVMWPDPDMNPRFEAINVQRVYFPKNTKMSPDKWEYVAFVREMTCSELYSKIRDKKSEKAAKSMGWNPDAIKSAIIYSQNTNSEQTNPYDYTKLQDRMVNNDLYYSSKGAPVEVVCLYVKQLSGKIGCYAFTRVSTAQNEQTVDGFLYENDYYADSFRDIIGAVWYDTGTDAMVHSIKGFGIKNYHFSVLQNRVKSRVVDGLTMQLALNFQRGKDVNDEMPTIEQYGPVNVLPAGLTQINTYPQFNQGFSVLEMLSNNQAENNSLYREQQMQISSTDTATQAKILAAQAGEMQETSASIYLAQVGENIYEQCMKRLRKKGSTNEDAKKFQKRCLLKGVPEEVLFKAHIRVKCGAAAGIANPMMRAMAFQEGLQLASMPGVNARFFLEGLIANRYGSRAITKALLPEGVDSEPAQRRQAMMENSDFGQGMPLPVAPTDAHFEHADEHLKPLDAKLAQSKRTGELSKDSLTAMLMAMEHTGIHVQFLKSDETKADKFRNISSRFTTVQAALRGEIARLERQNREMQHNMPVVASDVPPDNMPVPQ